MNAALLGKLRKTKKPRPCFLAITSKPASVIHLISRHWLGQPGEDDDRMYDVGGKKADGQREVMPPAIG